MSKILSRRVHAGAAVGLAAVVLFLVLIVTGVIGAQPGQSRQLMDDAAPDTGAVPSESSGARAQGAIPGFEMPRVGDRCVGRDDGPTNCWAMLKSNTPPGVTGIAFGLRTDAGQGAAARKVYYTIQNEDDDLVAHGSVPADGSPVPLSLRLGDELWINSGQSDHSLYVDSVQS